MLCALKKEKNSKKNLKIYKAVDLTMQAGDLVKLKTNFEEELLKIGFCGQHIHIVSMGFSDGIQKIAYIRNEDKLGMDFAVFSPFLEVPVQCLELASGKDIIKGFKMMKQNGSKDY